MTALAVTTEPADRTAALVEAWLAGRRSPHTRRAYRGDLLGQRGWLTWCTGARVDPLDARPAHVRQWLADLEQLGDAQATQARRLAAASSWYRWLIRQRAAGYNPADLDTTERPVVDRYRSTTLALSERQANALQEQADLDGPRSAALVALMLISGARVGELLAGDVEDITMQQGHPVLPIVGKGRRNRTLPLPPNVYGRLDTYLATRTAELERLPALAAGARPRRPLFATATGRRLSTWQVHRTLRKLAHRAGGDLAALADEISPHVTRHTWASTLLADGVPIDEVSDGLGHADVRTTRIYDHRHLDPARHPAYQMARKIRTATGRDTRHNDQHE